jgi:predicted glycoside hydrolase/deacetylase ChbG (UPF0249 family)
MNESQPKARLILHCDDLGMAHSINRAAFYALDENIVSSASVMVPCAWFPEVVEKSAGRSSWDLGIHFTLTSEWKSCRWGPVAQRSKVQSLIDGDGYFWRSPAALISHANPDEVKRELRAQMERALTMGMHPTHVDCHMFVVFQTPELFAAYAEVAREYRLPFLFVRQSTMAFEVDTTLIAADTVLNDFRMAIESWDPQRWNSLYELCVTTLHSGLNQITVHLGYDDEELRALAGKDENWGSTWRQRDLDVVSSAAFRTFLEREDVELCGWRDVTERSWPLRPANGPR